MKIVPSSSSVDEICAVCSDVQATTHFGVIVCRSCAAFFRRSIVLQRNYKCRNGKKCNIEEDARASCPACRFKKCLKVGMEAEKIRKNFDKNGPRRSTKIKEIKESPKPPPQIKYLPQMVEGYQRYLDDMKTLYYGFYPERIFTEEIIFDKATLHEHSFFDRTGLAYYVRMLNNYFCPFKDIGVTDKKRILEMFHFQFFLISTNYLTTIYFPNDVSKQFLHFGAYSDYQCMHHFFSQNKDVNEVVRSFSNVTLKFKKVGNKFRAAKIDVTEACAMIGIVLWREVVAKLPNKGYDVILDRLQEELASYCKRVYHLDPGRIARLMCLLRAVEELCLMLTESMTMGIIMTDDMPERITLLFQTQ